MLRIQLHKIPIFLRQSVSPFFIDDAILREGFTKKVAVFLDFVQMRGEDQLMCTARVGRLVHKS